MNNIKAILFDLDGTLLNTLDDLCLSLQYGLKKYHLPLPNKKEVQYYIGNGMRRLVADAIEDGFNNPLYEDIFLEVKNHYSNHMFDHIKEYEGISELLIKLKKEGYKIGIVSNKPDLLCKKMADLYFPNLIDVAIGDDFDMKVKPAPDTINKAIKLLNIKNNEALYIGDSDVDVLTAKNAKMKCISSLWGYRTKDEIKKAGGYLFANNCQDIIKIIKGENNET